MGLVLPRRVWAVLPRALVPTPISAVHAAPSPQPHGTPAQTQKVLCSGIDEPTHSSPSSSSPASSPAARAKNERPRPSANLQPSPRHTHQEQRCWWAARSPGHRRHRPPPPRPRPCPCGRASWCPPSCRQCSCPWWPAGRVVRWPRFCLVTLLRAPASHGGRLALMRIVQHGPRAATRTGRARA